MKEVFEFREYRPYLAEWIEEKGRGEKSRLAAAARCHLTYISQVLSGAAELSLEQAHDLNTYLNHSEDEGDYFLLLVTAARAGTQGLRAHFQRKIDRVQKDRLQLKNRLEFKKTLEVESQAIYYSSWSYAAIHVLLTIEAFQTREKIAERLKLPLQQVTKVLDFLEKQGLAVNEQGKYRSGEVSIHLGSDSPMITRHHSNWRMQAINSLDRSEPNDLHYSSVVSLAQRDIPEARAILLKAIEQVRALVRASVPEETICCYLIDLFEI